MAGLDDLLTPQENTIAGTDLTFVDADTIRRPDGSRIRIQGIAAPETAHFVKGQLETGEVGGALTTEQVLKLANELGYTNLVDSGNLDATGKRTEGDLLDKDGRSFRRALAAQGIVQVDPRYDRDNLQESANLGAFYRTEQGRPQNEWDMAREFLTEAIDADRKYATQFKQAQLVAGDARFGEKVSGESKYYSPHSAAFGYGDRDIGTGKSLNPLSDAWDTGLIGVQEASFGILELLGEKTGYQPLEHIGEAGIERARTRISDRGHFITDYKEVKGFGDAIEYITNNAALSLPYMGITVAGTVAAPFTGGVSLAAPAAIYAGQTWNEMEGENRDASIAVAAGVAQAALDRVGLGFIFKKGVGSTELLKKAVTELQKQGMTKEAAEATVVAATRKEMAGFVGDAAQVAADQLKAKKIFKDVAKRAFVGGTGEAATEALQESTAYIAAKLGSEGNFADNFDWNDLSDRAIQAAVAGGSLGGSFSLPGAAIDAGAWADVAVRQAPAEAKRLSQAGKFAEYEVEQHGRVATNQENAADARARGQANNNVTLEERRDQHNETRKSRTTGEVLADLASATPGLWRGATRHIFQPHLLQQSRSLRKLADIFGGGLQKTFSGATYENAKHHKVSIYRNMVAQPEQFFAQFLGGKRANRKNKQAISQEVYRQLNGATDPDGTFHPDRITGPHRDAILGLHQQLETLGNKMWQDQKQFNPDLGYIANYLSKYKSLNKNAIAKNRVGFLQALMAEGFTDAQANELADAILDNAEVNDINEALDATQAAGKPSAHKSRTIGMSEKDNFQEFFEQDIFANVSNAARSAARYTSFQEYIGEDHGVINQMLADAQAEGVDPKEINKIAASLEKYLQAESGNYNRPKSETGKTLQRVQKNFMMVTTFAGLPLATISSIVELALSMRGLTKDQIFGSGNRPGGLFNIGNELGSTLWKGMGEVVTVADKKERAGTSATKGQELLSNLGYYSWDVGAATTTGVTETNARFQDWYTAYFKWTGLQGWTNYTRSVRASIAGDYITDKLDIIAKNEGTNETQEAREALRNIGINVDDVMQFYVGGGQFDPNGAAILEENMREGMFNFVNDAVALPQSGNRPLIYQDPRFALFTQFQGFIATFTANHIPKLWGEYVARGTPAMKYNAFAIMATMIMLGFASQYLKDLIKYGELRQFGPDDHPFLNKSEYIQRGVRASGLLGTSERVLDQFFPLYDQRSDGVGEWAFNGITGESPAAGTVKRAGQAAGDLLTGDVGGAAKNLSRITPGIGPFNFIAEAAKKAGSSWNFGG